jgi:hypothetical protein
MAQYVTRMTAEQMAAESKKATEEGMRQVAAGLSARGLRTVHVEENSDSDESIVVKKKKNVVVDNGIIINKLETRVHYLQLDLANKDVDLIEAKDVIKMYKEKQEILKKVDDNIALLTNLSFYLTKLDTLTVPQMERKLALFKEESKEHSANCLKYIKQIEFQLVKNYMILALDEMNTKNAIIEKKMIKMISYKQCMETICLWLVAICILVVSIVFFSWINN